ncbi:hypothetical protein ACK9YZ_12150 [Rhizobium sp. ZK1]|uniref:hypothetical protein n=1 Tax=Rhizobium sp. ZK1 TaxID=3389872 RepID=UPI0039F7069D
MTPVPFSGKATQGDPDILGVGIEQRSTISVMVEDSAGIKALLSMPRRDNSAYLETLRLVREAFAEAEEDFGGKVLATTDSARDEAGNIVIMTVIRPA